MDLNSDFKVALLALLVGLVGVLVAVLLGVMYANGVLIDEFVTGSETITLTDIQAAVIVLFMVIGGVVGLTAKR